MSSLSSTLFKTDEMLLKFETN